MEKLNFKFNFLSVEFVNFMNESITLCHRREMLEDAIFMIPSAKIKACLQILKPKSSDSFLT